MATVSITSDLEPYLASLRTYLAQNNSSNRRRSASKSDDDEDKDSDALTSPTTDQRPEVGSLRRESGLSNGDKKSSSGATVGGSAGSTVRYPVEGGSRSGAAGGRV